tara:strand:- start:455 stop:1597 length:1143 start_codon:yes stop_codon:yes gene_type:complete
MKICHVFPFYSIKYAGGTCDLIYKIIKYQLKSNVSPTVISGDYNFDKDLANKIPKAEYIILKSYLNHLGFYFMPSLFKFCFYNLKKYDYIHFHAYRTFQNLVIYFFCRLYNVPYIIDAHGSAPYAKRKRFLKKIFDFFFGKSILKNAHKVVAETNIGIDEYLEITNDIEKKKLVVLSPPFDTDQFIDLPSKGFFRKKFDIDKNDKLILFLGRVHYIKGIDFLIKGFKIFSQKFTNTKLAIVGSDDGHMNELKTLTRKLNIFNKVIFTGFLDGSHKLSCLVDADIVTQTSRQEQGAWAPFEAVLCGTPIIVTSHTGSGEDVRKISAGELVDFDDNEGLSEKFDEIFNNYKYHVEKTLIAKKNLIDNYSFRGRIHEYLNLYK